MSSKSVPTSKATLAWRLTYGLLIALIMALSGMLLLFYWNCGERKALFAIVALWALGPPLWFNVEYAWFLQAGSLRLSLF